MKNTDIIKNPERSLTLTGKAGAEQIAGILESFREEPPKQINGVTVVGIEDYEASEHLDVRTGERSAINLPKSNVLKYWLADGSWICVRPSGTEPKAKFYFAVKGESMADSKEKLAGLEEELMKMVEELAVK